ncbi:MAG TPA: AMP-binding protein [Acidimicrobiales bacterium]|nr:AMP-binding protein [Acidimicrobiales bacterium]
MSHVPAAGPGTPTPGSAARDPDPERDAYRSALRSGMTLAHWASRQPDLPAVVTPGDPAGGRTWARLNAEANRLARVLRRDGLRPGDGVAAMVANRAEYVATYAAALRAGLRFTPINWHLTADEAAYIVDDCEAGALVADARFAEVAAGAARGAPAATLRLAVGGAIDGFEPYDEAVGAEDGADLPDPVLGRVMMYTSGTTGRPKGVHRTDNQRIARRTMPPTGYVPGESLHLCTGPLYHSAPLSFSLAGPLVAGVGVVLMDGWSAPATLRLIAEHRVTHSHMVPTMFHRLLALPEEEKAAADLSSLRMVIHGAAPCPVAVKRAIIDWWGPVLLEYYAATEGVGTFVTSEQWLDRPGTVGRPHDPDHIRILDPVTGESLPPGEVGTIYLRAPDVGRFSYFKDAGKTAESYRGDHFTMGDVGYLDEDGWLFLTDRSANLIISGGVNIYPAEVEEVLWPHEAVADVAVIGVPDDEWGESVLAAVQLRPGYAPSDELAAALIGHCRDRLAHYKCPRRVDFVESLPRTDAGKLYKRRLRDRYRAAATGGAAAASGKDGA